MKSIICACIIGIQFIAATVMAQGENIAPPAQGQTPQAVLSDIQSKINGLQSMSATLEFDEKDDDKPKKDENGQIIQRINPHWPEPPGRDVERGPIMIQRGVGAYCMLERKKDKAEYIANSSTIWKYDHKDKEARRVPSNWPIIDTFAQNALRMNVFVAMEPDSLKLLGTETIDGIPCWIIQGKSPSKLGLVGADQVKLKMWIGQADGIPRAIRVPGKDDLIIRLRHVVLNQPVDTSKFQFTPPSGVKVKNILGF